MREDVSFESGGLTCRGWYYPPANGHAPAPAIVMTHGFSAVKEQGLAGFAERFAAAGFAVLAFDCRYLGASGGAERGRIIPQEQHDDLRAALTWMSSRPGVDPQRIRGDLIVARLVECDGRRLALLRSQRRQPGMVHPVEHQTGQRHLLTGQPLDEVAGLPQCVRLG